MMDDDLFGSESDGSEDDYSERPGNFSSFFNQTFVEVMKLRPFLKAPCLRPCANLWDELLSEDVEFQYLKRNVAIFSLDDANDDCDGVKTLLHRLLGGKFENVHVFKGIYLDEELQKQDAIILPLFGTEKVFEICLHVAKWLVPGGLLMMAHLELQIPPDLLSLYDLMPTNAQPMTIQNNQGKAARIICLRKRVTGCNPKGAPYWPKNLQALAQEDQWLQDISVPLSAAEIYSGTLCHASHKRAVDTLRNHGVCILRGIFNKKKVLEIGDAARRDMRAIIRALRQRGIDLLNIEEGQKIDNFHEVSMREAYRCDLRNGRHMAAVARDAAAAFPCERPNRSHIDRAPTVDPLRADVLPSAAAHVAVPAKAKEEGGERGEGGGEGAEKPQQQQQPPHQFPCDLRRHPAIMAIVLDAMNPRGGPEARGNWGRWNFEGGGPDSGPPPMAVGAAGCVMSLPGCTDQTIHADTSHLYVHTQLPPHYVNLFIPAVPGYDDDSQCDNDDDDDDDDDDAIDGDGDGGDGCGDRGDGQEGGKEVWRGLTQEEARWVRMRRRRRARSHRMGQTAFVLGSHHLRVAARVMVADAFDAPSEGSAKGKGNGQGEGQGQEDDGMVGQQLLDYRLVRPHLEAGDALLFDCRILHFGLANKPLTQPLTQPKSREGGAGTRAEAGTGAGVGTRVSQPSAQAAALPRPSPLPSPPHAMTGADAGVDDVGDTDDDPLPGEADDDPLPGEAAWRPMIYVNYHQTWFHDPKNWNEAERLLSPPS